MSNGLAKLGEGRVARHVDLLSDFYDQWKKLHELRHSKAERDELEVAAQDLLECYVAIETYRKRHAN